MEMNKHTAEKGLSRFGIGLNHEIGDNNRVFVIAEIGNNHQGDFEQAVKTLEAAAEAKADAVSFQYAPLSTYCTPELYDHPNLAFLKECEFSLEQLAALCTLAKKHKMAFSVSVEDDDTVDKMIDLGIDFIKICSGDLINTPYLQHCAKTGLPIFFSTGAAYLGEIEKAWHAIRAAGCGKYVLYHTNSGYPTPISNANILQMDLLHEVFGGIKGYCDHTVDLIPPVVAVARGAKVIEKHITMDRNLRGDDWMVSLEPEEFKSMVCMVREAEQALGSRVKEPMTCEEGTRLFKRKSIVSRRDIAADEILSLNDFTYKLPGTGLAPDDVWKLIGKQSAKDIAVDTTITWEMINGEGE